MATAASGAGSFLVQGSPRLPPGSEFVFSPLLIVQNDTRGVASFVLEASNVTLVHFEEPFQELDTPALALQRAGEKASQEHSFVHVRLSNEGPSRGGFVGFLPASEGVARLAPSRPPVVEPRERTDVTTAQWVESPTQSSGGRADDPTFRHTIASPHLACEGAGGITYSGGGTLKIFGMDLRVASAGREQVFRTGIERASDDPAREGVRRWVVLQFEEGTLSAQSMLPWLIAGAAGEASWSGEASFLAASGELTTVESRYLPVPSRPVALNGSFTAGLLPERAREEGRDLLLRMSIQGDLASTSLRQEALETVVPRVLPSSMLAWWLAGCVAFVAAAGVGGYSWGRKRSGHRSVGLPWRRRGTPGLPFTIEDCQEAGAAAAAVEDWASAADWFGRGLKLAPTSARLTCDLGYALSQIGDHDQALRLFEEASQLSTDGEADFNGALAALRAGRPLEEVESWLERALARSPEFVAHLEEDEDFVALRGRPQFDAAVADAWEAYPWRGDDEKERRRGGVRR